MMWKLVCGEGGRGVGWGRGVGELRRGYDIGAEAWRGGRSGQYGPGCSNHLEPAGFFESGSIPKENMFGFLALQS